MSGLTIRRHRPADEPRIAEMMLALDGESAGIRPTNRDNIARTFAHLAGDPARGACAVAEASDASLVGYALVFPFWSAEYGGLLTLLDELWVAPAMRSRGVGAQLMDWVEVEARRQNHVAVSLLAMNHNTRAQSFYLRAGYVVVPATSFDKLLR